LAGSYLSPPPTNFRSKTAADLSFESMLATIRDGRAGTAMMPFSAVLDESDMLEVVQYIRCAFIEAKGEVPHAYYHTEANGWPDHQRYRAAFPFALGQIGLDVPWEKLSEEQRLGKRIFLSACITCHDRGRNEAPEPIWEARPLSYPRAGYSLGQPRVDAVSGASPYAVHDHVPRLARLNASQKRGEKLYQDNCAFCHAADGTGRNWIGSFLEPHPGDLTAPRLRHYTRDQLIERVRTGVTGTAMPTWGRVLNDEQISAIVDYVQAAFMRRSHP